MFRHALCHKQSSGFEIVLKPTKSCRMSVLFLLVFASIAVAVGFLGAFLWSVRNNQFEDQQGAALRILHDDPIVNSNVSDNK